jgi:hypothetical protein
MEVHPTIYAKKDQVPPFGANGEVLYYPTNGVRSPHPHVGIGDSSGADSPGCENIFAIRVPHSM